MKAGLTERWSAGLVGVSSRSLSCSSAKTMVGTYLDVLRVKGLAVGGRLRKLDQRETSLFAYR